MSSRAESHDQQIVDGLKQAAPRLHSHSVPRSDIHSTSLPRPTRNLSPTTLHKHDPTMATYAYIKRQDCIYTKEPEHTLRQERVQDVDGLRDMGHVSRAALRTR
jgi:hypothetical protein